MEIIPIIIVILIVSAIRNAIEQAKKKQQQSGGQQGEQTKGRRFPEFPDINELPGFPGKDSTGQWETKASETKEQAKDVVKDAAQEVDKGKAFVDDKIERYRQRKSSKNTDNSLKDMATEKQRYSTYDDIERTEIGSITREMTSSKKELKKGIIWKEILDGPKFKKI